MDNTPTDRKCFPCRSPNHTNGKTRNVSCFSRLLRRLNRTTKINVISSVQEYQVSNEGQTMSREEFDRVLQERINSLIIDQLRRRDDQITMLQNQVLQLTEDVNGLLSNPNTDTIIRQSHNGKLSQTGNKAGASSSNDKEQLTYTEYYDAMRRIENKKKTETVKGTPFQSPVFDITGASPTPDSSIGIDDILRNDVNFSSR